MAGGETGMGMETDRTNEPGSVPPPFLFSAPFAGTSIPISTTIAEDTGSVFPESLATRSGMVSRADLVSRTIGSASVEPMVQTDTERLRTDSVTPSPWSVRPSTSGGE